jgi:hypothetical protein
VTRVDRLGSSIRSGGGVAVEETVTFPVETCHSVTRSPRRDRT